jgi:hypothetical protein
MNQKKHIQMKKVVLLSTLFFGVSSVHAASHLENSVDSAEIPSPPKSVMQQPSPSGTTSPAKTQTPVKSLEGQPAKKNGPAPKSSLLESFLGPMKPILMSPNRVESFIVGAEIADASVPAESQLGGFPILELGPELTPEQLKQLQTIVLDDKNYVWQRTKKCLFRPEVGLRFIKGAEETAVLLSTWCNIWSFSYQDQEKTKDFDPAAKKITALLKSIFPTKEFPLTQ